METTNRSLGMAHLRVIEQGAQIQKIPCYMVQVTPRTSDGPGTVLN